MKRYFLFKVTLLITLSFWINHASSQLVINEYSCSNLNTHTDAFGENEDWVEIYNGTASPIDLSGYFLSDKASNLMKWQIPSGTVPANGYVMVVGSKRNTTLGGELHPNFNLKQTRNDWIILANNLGNVLDSIKIIHRTKKRPLCRKVYKWRCRLEVIHVTNSRSCKHRCTKLL